jgi:hypothetical protein
MKHCLEIQIVTITLSTPQQLTFTELLGASSINQSALKEVSRARLKNHTNDALDYFTKKEKE